MSADHVCTYPKCNCPFDAPSDPNWCARGLPKKETPKLTPLDVQVGGDHYKKLPIQPIEYAMANKLDACQFNIVRYVTRFRDKNGIQDLEKARHTLDILIELEKKRVSS